jgi:transposase-like protein
MTTTDLLVCKGRRRWSATEKARIAEESFAAGASAAAVARRYNVHPSVIYAWRRQARAGELSPAAKDRVRFVPVAVSSGDVSTASLGNHDNSFAIEVGLRNGRILRVPDGVAPGRASALADALEGVGR